MNLHLADALDAIFAALVDGGDGFDSCKVAAELPNVRVVNCEDGRSSRR